MAYDQEIMFLKKLIEDKCADKLKSIPKDDWGRLQNLALDFGFNVSVTGLQVVLPEKFYEDFGWNIPEKMKA
ncbi:hypothetical protein [Desulfonema magnum]|uniref:Uncharacterized protein n=1 Tax=Desulfonema magnum TaxID=45655 RepID=A0A975BNZ9_9BACT|nr:hypothetical protein [Desulfonema magnum]QTA89209.1 Uncharacterized protein dnm_052590 [Desulfonema magnum]